MEELKKIAEKIDGLSLRERSMVFIGVLVVIFSIWNSVLISPLQAEQKQLIADLNKKNVERLALNTGMLTLIKKSKQNPDAENMLKLKELRSKVINVQAELELSTDKLVSPADMPKLLETVLHKTGGIILVNLRSLGVTPLIAKEESEKSAVTDDKNNSGNETKLTAANIDNAYRHGLRIEFIGDYLTILDYLKSLESLEWGFYWDSFELSVGEYPDATASIEVFTLSLQQDWIGV